MPYSIHTISGEDAKAFVCEATWGMAEVAPDGTFNWVNPAYCKILDAPHDLIIGTKFADWTHPDDLAVDLELAKQVLEGAIPSYTLLKRYIKRGSTPQHPRIVWGILSVSGKWAQQAFQSYRVQFQPLDPYSDLPLQANKTWKRNVSELLQWTKANWKPALRWTMANWKSLSIAIFVLLSLTWGSSERLLDVLLRAKQAADQAKQATESLDGVLSPSSRLSPGPAPQP